MSEVEPSAVEPPEVASEPDLPASEALKAAVLEVEEHAAELGWDQPARLFALVQTGDLLAHEPELAAELGLVDQDPDGLTPIQQDEIEADRFEQVLESIGWPPAVFGCAAVVERLVLPPSADGAVPQDFADAQSFAREHPDREEVRIVVAATRDGGRYCALRLRSHDEPLKVIAGEDLVPELVDLLAATLIDLESGPAEAAGEGARDE